MATSSSYYINAPSLGSATAIFADIDLSVCAADGFYSDGVIVREQVNCVLLPQQVCPSCAVPCDSAISETGEEGIYLLDFDTGDAVSDIGAIIIRFNPADSIAGIRATFGTNVYNKVTSPVDGAHQSLNSGQFTFIGQSSNDCGISGTTYPALAEYVYDGLSFMPTGNFQSLTVNALDVSLGVLAPGNTMMVIPKLTPSPSIVNFEVVGPCALSNWNISINCPILLTGFGSSTVAINIDSVCMAAETTTYYHASLGNTPGTIGLYDFVFEDAYGSLPLHNGWYKAVGSIVGSNVWFEVNNFGVVVAVGTCTPTYNCINGECSETLDGTGTYPTLNDCLNNCSPSS
jgi:hypothetical protein